VTRKRLVVVGSGGRPFREYALKAMSRRADLLLLSSAELSWEKPYVADFRRCRVDDVDTLVELTHGLAPDGLLTYDERLVLTVAGAAARIGVAHTAPEAVRLCKDKSALRRRLAEAGLGPVRFAVVETVPEAVDATALIGYPVVCKPLALGGSIGVVRADDERELVEAFEVAATARADDGTKSAIAGVLIEEYLAGPEYSVDCVVWEGTPRPVVVAEKTVGYPPYFEELGHVVPGGPHPDLDAAIQLVLDAHQAVGLDRLVTHSEVKLTADGPRIVEINVRLAGDLIPYLGTLSSGVDVAAAAADVAVGQAPDLTVTRSRVASITMIYPAQALRVDGVRLRRDPSAYAGLDQLTTFLPPGTEVRLPPEAFLSRVGFAVVTGPDREECLARRAVIDSDIVVDGMPLSGG